MSLVNFPEPAYGISDNRLQKKWLREGAILAVTEDQNL